MILAIRCMIGSLILLGIAGCTLGPDYQRPRTPVHDHETYINAPAPETLSEVIAGSGVSRWWERMEDDQMAGYVGLLLLQNLRLQEAAARVDQAWAQLRMQRGGWWPVVSGSVSGSRQMIPLSGTTFTEFPLPGESNTADHIYVTQWDIGLSARWQLDLFGRVRRGTESAEAFLEASLADAEALTHSLIAEVARTRVRLATLQRQLELSGETVESRWLTLSVVERRYERGVRDASALDVYLARENLSAARADMIELRQQMSAEAYTLDLLLGRTPGSTDPRKVALPILPPPQKPPTGLPAQLLDRRPDLRSAELRLKAATARIGVAIADLYPDLTLSASIGFQNDELRGWFSTSNLAGTLMGDILVRLFEGGRLRANIDLQKAQAEEAAAVYAGQILSALQEVETALSDEAYLAEQLEELDVQRINIRRAEELAWSSYRRGLRPLLDVLDAQRRRYMIEQTYLLAAQSAWNSRIALYLALGGDWMEDRGSP
jgi:NodT family efflux transporter outer membrane factor (OMF) lipoprotein